MAERLHSSNILIVEDNALLACDLQDLLGDFGANAVGPAHNVMAGMALLDSEPVDAALLDVNLGDDFVWPIARKLRDMTIPFAFLSAACTQDDVPDDLRPSVCLDKPATSQKIIDTLGKLLGR